MTPMTFSSEDHTQFFARIHLHGVTKTSNGTPCSIDLERRPSFPMPADCTNVKFTNDHDKDLSTCPLAPRYDIEARVCFDCPVAEEQESPLDPQFTLGFGRTGIVYPLEILSFKHATSQTWDNKCPLPSCPDSEETEGLPTLPPLCIKIAQPGYARKLAREAWFYEHLDARGLTGHVAPRCYGVFHTSHVPDEMKVDIPGYDYHGNSSMPIFDGSTVYTAPMLEEFYDDESDTVDDYSEDQGFMDDVKKSHTKSEWKRFQETPEVTTMTVLVMDMLGARITKEDFEKDWEEDINDIWDHLALLDIVHKDIRFPNVLQVPPHLQVPCPMHPNAAPGHKWNLVDWEDAKIVCIGLKNRIGLWDQRLNLCHYYHRVGGKQNLRRNWKDYFDVRDTGEFVYLGCHKDRLSKAKSVEN